MLKKRKRSTNLKRKELWIMLKDKHQGLEKRVKHYLARGKVVYFLDINNEDYIVKPVGQDDKESFRGNKDHLMSF